MFKIAYKSGSATGNSNSTLFLTFNKKNSSEVIKKFSIPKDTKTGETFYDLNSKGFKGGSVVFHNAGEKLSQSTEDFRVIGAKLFKSSLATKKSKIVISTKNYSNFETPLEEIIKGLVEGATLASYKMTEGKSKAEKSKNLEFEVYASPAEAKKIKPAITEAQATCEAIFFSRRLGDLPGNMMTPSILAKEAQSIKSPKLKTTIWNKARIKKEKMGGIMTVSRGSAEEPRFIIMEYKGGATKQKPLVLVGKGLTFDAGGISLKPSPKMDEMRYDMCGSAAVIGAMKLITSMKLKVNVTALVPSSENLLGAEAVKPGDIFTARNGKTVEVLNTDAEGRLILADALSYASELKPAMVLNTATLTGAMVMALGNSHTGLFTRSDELADNVLKASKNAGENVWRMPLTDDHVNDIKGRFADWANISSFRGAGSATAAAFLEQFCAKGIPFAHMDIAGTAWNCGNRKAYNQASAATGVLVRTFYEFAKSI